LIMKGVNVLLGKLIGDGGVLSALGSIGSAIGGLFGIGGSAAGGAAGAAGTVAGAAGGVGSAAGAAGTGAGGIAGSVASTVASTGWQAGLGLAFGGVSAATGVIGVFQAMHQETSLNAIELNTRETKLALMGAGGPEAGGILGVQWLIKENTEYAFQSLDSIKNTLWEMKPMLSDLAWTWIEKVESNTLGALRKLEDFAPNINRLEGILDGITEVRADLRRVIEVNVTGFGSNREVGLEIARAMKAQGALAW